MQAWGGEYPHAGYGGIFCLWLREETLKRLPEDIRKAYELFRKNALDRMVSVD